jgi:GNAT superfamily N-acetyltransferase
MQISTALFDKHATLQGHVAEADGEIAAMALRFVNLSTWDGVAGVYLEDLYVRPRFRRRGLARALLTALARESLDNGYTRPSWAVLDWNANAISLYDAIGGQPQGEWTTSSGPPIDYLARS